MPELPRIFCYARSSTDEQKDSVKCQEGRFKDKCDELEAKGEGKFYKLFPEIESATEVAWTARKEFSNMVKELEEGDIVLCWTLSRIDRNPIRMLHFAEFCVNRGIHLFLLKEPFMHGNEVELTTAMGRAFLYMGAIFNDFWMEHHKEATRSAIEWRRKNGMVYTGTPHRCKRRTWHHVDGKKDPVPVDTWDIATCQLYAEMYTRWKYHGESISSIARDMNHRKERTCPSKKWPNGSLICPTLHKDMPKALQYPNYRRFRNVWNYLVKEIESHNGMMGDVETPYYPDVSQMRIKPVNSTRNGYFILRD